MFNMGGWCLNKVCNSFLRVNWHAINEGKTQLYSHRFPSSLIKFKIYTSIDSLKANYI